MTDPIQPLTPEQTASQETKAAQEGYIHRSLASLDQFVNVLTGGLPDETLSSRSARASESGKLWGRTMSRFLNLFQSDHGAKSQAADDERAKEVEKVEHDSGGIS